MKIYVAQLNPLVGDVEGNTNKVIDSLEIAKEQGAEIVLFSEMVLCGYPSEDLVFFPTFIEKMERALVNIAPHTKGLFAVVGFVRKNTLEGEKPLFNSAAVFEDGKLLGFKDKTLLPTYDVFDERRYFEPGKEQKVFTYKGKRIGILICEDAWQHSKVVTDYNRDPVMELLGKVDLLLIPSASPYYYEKLRLREKVYSLAAKTLNCPLILCNQIGGNDSLVFDGYSFCLNEKGKMTYLGKGFEEDGFFVEEEKVRKIDPVEDLYRALIFGVKDYFSKQGFTKAVLGLSGGIDSALTLCIAVEALGNNNVLTLSMPSRYSSLGSIEDARKLAENLEVELWDLPIDTIYQEYLDFLSPIFYKTPFGTAEENLQARIRGNILMAISNKFGYVVLSTGNKSEMAMGYATLYGDMCGGLGVLVDVPKTMVYRLANYLNREKEIIPEVIIQKPPSAELKSNQKDQDDLPPYEIVDLVLEAYVEDHLSIEKIVEKYHLSLELVTTLVRKIHKAEFKRRQAPTGIQVTKKAFGKGRVFPIVQGFSH